IPRFHATAHHQPDVVDGFLLLRYGYGHTDGECVEANWAALNPLNPSAHQMEPGQRHDCLDVALDWNWR
ncbi:hypothetical protein C8R43DRAFT_844854, partial [Mycena crocata]